MNWLFERVLLPEKMANSVYSSQVFQFLPPYKADTGCETTIS